MYLAQILNIPSRLIIELILCCIFINIIYSSIYFYLYKNNDIHFTPFNIQNADLYDIKILKFVKSIVGISPTMV